MKIMYQFCRFIVAFSFFGFLYGCATSPTADLPDKKRTELELYLTATEANDLLEKEGKNILFVDVRTRGEVAKGAPALIDAHVPFVEKGEDKKLAFNENLVSAVEARLKEKGLSQEDRIILICRNGNRTAGATNQFAEAGYKTVYTITDGTIGWKENNLPWIDEIDEEKYYQP
jgi:rhodanese-related sulfurtransferase